MIATVIVAVAEWERDSTSERTVLALEALRTRGKPISRPAVADRPELAAEIREMRKTMTLQQIADSLNERRPDDPRRRALAALQRPVRRRLQAAEATPARRRAPLAMIVTLSDLARATCRRNDLREPDVVRARKAPVSTHERPDCLIVHATLQSGRRLTLRCRLDRPGHILGITLPDAA
jgi:hypothetical protein